MTFFRVEEFDFYNMKEKDFEFGDVRLHRFQYCEQLAPDDALGVLDGGDSDLTGVLFWEGTLAFAHWLVDHKELFVNKSIFELGSGTLNIHSSGNGLVGLILAQLGQKTILSDRSRQILALLKVNTQALVDRTVQIEQIEWGSSDVSAFRPVDTVVGSEVVYAVEVIPLLFATVSKLCGPTSLFVLMFNCRSDRLEVALLQELATRQLTFTREALDITNCSVLLIRGFQ